MHYRRYDTNARKRGKLFWTEFIGEKRKDHHRRWAALHAEPRVNLNRLCQARPQAVPICRVSKLVAKPHLDGHSVGRQLGEIAFDVAAGLISNAVALTASGGPVTDPPPW